MRKVYRGKDIEVSFDLDQCVHIGECLRGEPRAFQLTRRPWVLPDAGDADTVAEVILRCPSGALQFRRLDGGPDEEHEGTRRQGSVRLDPIPRGDDRAHGGCSLGPSPSR